MRCRSLCGVVALWFWCALFVLAAEDDELAAGAPSISASGQVVDPNGKPVAGARVVLREWASLRYSENLYSEEVKDVLAETTTDGVWTGPIQLLLSREGAWDSQKLMVGRDGKFRFENVPEQEPVTFVACIPGYQLAQDRNRMQQIREWSVAMFVDGPRDDIEIIYEPATVAK